jgi:uncharacterized membrane protein SpoIIM required for sporulation
MIGLLIEATFVGAMLALALIIVDQTMGMPTSSVGILAMGFVVGALIHLVCEITGLNKMYCSTGYACRR